MAATLEMGAVNQGPASPPSNLAATLIDRRIEQMTAEGVTFHYNENIGVTRKLADLQQKHDAVLLSGGSEHPRDVEHREDHEQNPDHMGTIHAAVHQHNLMTSRLDT